LLSTPVMHSTAHSVPAKLLTNHRSIKYTGHTILRQILVICVNRFYAAA
jgi:hypothetical protein